MVLLRNFAIPMLYTKDTSASNSFWLKSTPSEFISFSKIAISCSKYCSACFRVIASPILTSLVCPNPIVGTPPISRYAKSLSPSHFFICRFVASFVVIAFKNFGAKVHLQHQPHYKAFSFRFLSAKVLLKNHLKGTIFASRKRIYLSGSFRCVSGFFPYPLFPDRTQHSSSICPRKRLLIVSCLSSSKVRELLVISLICQMFTNS